MNLVALINFIIIKKIPKRSSTSSVRNTCRHANTNIKSNIDVSIGFNQFNLNGFWIKTIPAGTYQQMLVWEQLLRDPSTNSNDIWISAKPLRKHQLTSQHSSSQKWLQWSLWWITSMQLHARVPGSLPFLSMDAPALLHCLSVDLGGFLGWLEDYYMKSCAI